VSRQFRFDPVELRLSFGPHWARALIEFLGKAAQRFPRFGGIGPLVV
jgi:hypothetical protein